MQPFAREIEVVDSHTEGEPTRLVLAGVGPIEGATMAEKAAWLRREADEVRTALTREPRGHEEAVVAFATEPTNADADLGVVFANDAGYLGMCGHGAMGVAATLARLGRVEVEEPETLVVLDTPAGAVRAWLRVRGRRVRTVRVRNVPSFVWRRGVEVRTATHGAVAADVAYGGNWFAFVRAADLGLEVVPGRLHDLMAAAREVRDALAAQGVEGADPTSGAPAPIDHVKLYVEEEEDGVLVSRALTLCPGRAYDRSPCGTGTSAKLALLVDQGRLEPGLEIRSRSIVGTEFRAVATATTRVGDRLAVVPEIEGRAFVTALSRVVMDRDDPLARGLDPIG